ncbi:GntR family transcriptional regulator [Bremerella cremea]|uniref:GntR family transcriptional regulator n=1 Tax=Blastopirellula marina TaxID=124 RepID=A0A2S8FQ89_9BACT|nr:MULTISPECIES: GntR family transcriptional regulator [Pirellulaceae]PQO34353.1 GntR family transcriptional regulator [Blastopirellula marina]RCS46849.1 GntR family transcriptional regulator [Bremerella cremea]
MQIDPKSHTPIFRQIADQIRGRIRSGVHRPGESLPSLRQLALDIKVNPNTIQRAYELLEREGMIESRRGVGIFVAEENAAPRSIAEQQIQQRLAKLVDSAAAKGINIERLRTLFEDTLQTRVQDT